MPLPARRQLSTPALALIPRAVALNLALGAVVASGAPPSDRAHSGLRAQLELQRSRGAAAVITHDLKFAQDACDHNVTIAHGHVSNIGMISLERAFSEP